MSLHSLTTPFLALVLLVTFPVAGLPAQETESRRAVEAASLLFDEDSADLPPSAGSTLDPVGRSLARDSDLRIRVEGHADSVGVAGYNYSISLRRARAVRDYLLESFPGIEADRLEVRGFGESRPVADNGTEEGRQRNRRVEFVIVGESASP